MTQHVALVFPGRRYGPEMPLLHYPAQVLRERGADVHVIDYPQFLVSADAPDQQTWERATELITRAVAEAVAGASQVTLLAKSLGTRAIARLPDGLLPDSVHAAWLTPIFTDAATAKAAAAKTWRSLYVYGTADPSCDEAVLREIVAVTGGTVLSVDRADHGLEVEGDAVASVDALLRVVRAVAEWPAT